MPSARDGDSDFDSNTHADLVAFRWTLEYRTGACLASDTHGCGVTQFAPSTDKIFSQSFAGIVWPRAAVGAASFWNFNSSWAFEGEYFLPPSVFAPPSVSAFCRRGWYPLRAVPARSREPDTALNLPQTWSPATLGLPRCWRRVG